MPTIFVVPAAQHPKPQPPTREGSRRQRHEHHIIKHVVDRFSTVAPVVKALQYEKRPLENRRPRKTVVALVVFTMLCFAIVIASSAGREPEEEEHSRDDDKKKKMNECRLDAHNCTSDERCEDTISSFLCIACPEYHVPSHNGIECIIECPLHYTPSVTRDTCNLACLPNYITTADGLRCTTDVCAPPGQLMAEQKINSLEGGLRHDISPGDRFGAAIAPMGDVDGNGMADFAVGASQFDTDANTRHDGYICIIFLNRDHTVLTHQKIGIQMNGLVVGGLANTLDPDDHFGASLACLGDLDGDGVPDLIVGAPGDDDGGTNRGALYVLFMLATGSVKSQQKISSEHGGLANQLKLAGKDSFGWEVSVVGEVDKVTGVVDVMVVPYFSRGVYFIQLNLDGTVKRAYQLWESEREHTTIGGVAGVGDVDGNGVVDIAVGLPKHYQVGKKFGTVSVLLMSVEGDGGGEMGLKQKEDVSITHADGGDEGMENLRSFRFGDSVAGLGDLDGDGTPDLAVGAYFKSMGVVHILLLRPTGSVKRKSIISQNKGGLVGPLSVWDEFGTAMATLVERGDSEEGVVTLAVGASGDRSTVKDGGAVYLLKVPPGFVEVCPAPNEKCINSGDDGYTCG